MSNTFYSSRNVARASGLPFKDAGADKPNGLRWFTVGINTDTSTTIKQPKSTPQEPTFRLVLRTSNKDGKAHNDFQWPVSGLVECPDWNPAVKCGNGLHGILWPEGDWSDIKEYNEELWQVVRVQENTLVRIDGKVKFPRGEVIYSGNMAVAFNMVAKEYLAHSKKDIAKIIAETKCSTSSSGDSAQIGSSGDSAQIGSSGDYAKIGSSGDYAKIGSSGDSAQIGSSGDYAKIGSSGYSAQIGSSGDSAQIGSSGDYAKIGSSGDSAQIGSSGDYAKIGSSGYSAQIGSSGDSAQIGSSGDYAKIGSSGDSAQIDNSGKDAVIACADSVQKFRVGANGCISVPWHDGKRARIAVGYVCENIKQDTWYCLDDLGNFVEL